LKNHDGIFSQKRVPLAFPEPRVKVNDLESWLLFFHH
jgi:hypothetical protein